MKYSPLVSSLHWSTGCLVVPFTGYRPEKERQDFLLHWDHSLVGKGNTVKQNQITSECKRHEDIAAGCGTKEHQDKGRQGHQRRPLWLANLLWDDLWAGPPWPPSVWFSTSILSNQSAYVFLITGLGSWVHKWLLLAPKDEKKSLYSETKGDFSFLPAVRLYQRLQRPWLLLAVIWLMPQDSPKSLLFVYTPDGFVQLLFCPHSSQTCWENKSNRSQILF